MSVPTLIIYSQRPEDVRFFIDVASQIGVKHACTTNLNQLEVLVRQYRSSVVVWSLDNYVPGMEASDDVAMLEENERISRVLENLVPSWRVIAVLGQGISRSRVVPKGIPAFRHCFVRDFESSASPVLVAAVAAVFDPVGMVFKRFFSDGASGHQIALKKSSHRGAAVEAVQSFFQKVGVGARLSAKVAQSVDELLLNAVYDAPHDLAGRPSRHDIPRTEEIQFGKREVVQLEAIVDEKYAGICVTDSFGSIHRDTLMKLLQFDFRSSYCPPAARIGIQGILHMGFSLMYACRPGIRTDAMLFFPRSVSHRQFRSGFRFFSFLDLSMADRIIMKPFFTR